MSAVIGVQPLKWRASRQARANSRSSPSMVSMSRMRGSPKCFRFRPKARALPLARRAALLCARCSVSIRSSGEPRASQFGIDGPNVRMLPVSPRPYLRSPPPLGDRPVLAGRQPPADHHMRWAMESRRAQATDGWRILARDAAVVDEQELRYAFEPAATYCLCGRQPHRRTDQRRLRQDAGRKMLAARDLGRSVRFTNAGVNGDLASTCCGASIR
jgi:hypothetical protein